MSQVKTPHFSCAAHVAFALMPFHRVAIVRIAGAWTIKVLP